MACLLLEFHWCLGQQRVWNDSPIAKQLCQSLLVKREVFTLQPSPRFPAMKTSLLTPSMSVPTLGFGFKL